MNTETTTTTPPSANLSVEQLAQRLSKRVNSPAAPSPTTPAATTPPPDIQPGEGEPAAPVPPVVPPAEPSPAPPEVPAEPGEPASPPTEPEAEPTAETLAAAADLDELRALIPKDKQELIGRVHELLKHRKDARTEVETVKAQLQEAQQAIQQLREGSPTNLTAIDRFSAHPDVQPLDARLATVDATLDWCDANPEGGEVTDAAGKAHTFTAADVRKMQRNAERERPALAADRAVKVGKLEQAELTRRQAAEAIADQTYPWLKQQQSPEFQMMLEAAGQIPGVVHSPEMTLVLGDLVRGRQARLAEAKAKAAPAKRAAAPAPPNITTTAAGAPRVADPLAAQVKQAELNYRKSGRTEDYIVLSKLRDQQKAASTQRRAA